MRQKGAMGFYIGDLIEVDSLMYLGRVIRPLERGKIEGAHLSPVGQTVFDIRLKEDGKLYTFAPGEISKVG